MAGYFTQLPERLLAWAVRQMPTLLFNALQLGAELALTLAGLAWLAPAALPWALAIAAVTLAAPLAAQKINEERPLEVQEDESRRLFAARVLPVLRRGAVAVLSGFFARSTRGDLTTLGRGGSDISGVLVGRFLDAEEVTIVTDVEGILSADPRLAESPRLIEEMTVEDLETMASRGARVVHPRALRYKPANCRVRVVDFRRQEALAHSGTSVLGKGLSVTRTLAFVSRRIAAICSGSRSGLIGFTIPATMPDRSVTAVSVQLGRR